MYPKEERLANSRKVQGRQTRALDKYQSKTKIQSQPHGTTQNSLQMGCPKVGSAAPRILPNHAQQTRKQTNL